jgi:hypothetical protein
MSTSVLGAAIGGESDAISVRNSDSLQCDQPWLTHSQDASPCLPVLRVVAASIVISLVWKWQIFVTAVAIYTTLPLHDDFFPRWLQSTTLVIVCYCTALGSVVTLMASSNRQSLIAAASVAAICLGILCIHQQSYNDVTFLTCFWTVLWCLWFIRQLGQPAAYLMPRATFLAHSILSVIFLGGTVGKLTAGYWSGEVLYAIYFEGRDHWLFNYLRGNFTTETLEQIACWYSRLIILVEGTCSCLWLMPPRLASLLAIVVLCNIALMSNPQLFSVLTCLIGLGLVGQQKRGQEPFR